MKQNRQSQFSLKSCSAFCVFMTKINVVLFNKAFHKFTLSSKMRKLTIWVPTRSDTNRSQKIVRGCEIWIYKVEKLYYPCSENKSADQLRSYCEADLCLCFHLCRLLVFPCSGSNLNQVILHKSFTR